MAAEPIFSAKGYAVAEISYRVVPQARWPEPRDDAVTAVDYLKSHSDELEIDTDNWSIIGRSAGGQIAESWLTI